MTELKKLTGLKTSQIYKWRWDLENKKTPGSVELHQVKRSKKSFNGGTGEQEDIKSAFSTE